MVQLTSCCGCCSVKTGTIILAVLEILSGLMFFVDGISATGNPQTKSAGLSVLFFGLVLVIFNSLQIYGTVKKMKNYMLPSIILRFITLILSIILQLICIFVIEIFISIIKSKDPSVNIPKEAEITLRVVLGVLLLLTLILGTYFALIPLSHYNELKFERNQPRVAFENARSPYANSPPTYNP